MLCQVMLCHMTNICLTATKKLVNGIAQIISDDTVSFKNDN